ncbi:MAG TPA: bifunctional (p)ppGpp synthetase/guanosine-3',5'-bis(diphosphate) 3'-pyrophosphohydrolase [Bacilli bacterium]|jgi:GTP pyrophosphokinase|nr:bifunctional (p)ppGpp synthetase/guanosine-3',5'-bis(diphosphate) 3'-pyrophosphohydrolase [Bacilli bacterium]HOD60758.1 bifunctional (p)ppGpp synthetase/guanosine-3',5'-bis(diphosphate) 3'-pyrophosphohydrolase [Bacilli bacterium]HOH61700.1 bifunctional (p)ppGpp synthetase/guanosine-3',5'-bis(diphosphate) 3'-pyrophosphohydrolase [Bacilli bacterium]HPM15455.1 bifunctional (p)ppGpp synthetase/guanosine-3',5'-bis(diphosphate) 3'-pyrophosphohydrolase [Bacilli bacterium]HPY54094.1 bifunctional (p)
MGSLDRKVTFEDVIAKASEYLKNPKNIALIKDAYEVANEKHFGQFRKSKDPYIQHPLEVAYMLAELRASPATIAAGLLHDILEDTDVDRGDLENRFGKDVVSIVDGVTKISKLKYMTVEKALAKTHQKILLAMAKDIRVILVKLLDRVHNMRTLEFQPEDKQRKIARETLDLYAPLAHRLGMYRIKAELEDTAYKYLEPIEYERINSLITEQKMVREEDIQKMKDKITEILVENGFKSFEIRGRIKNIFSVNKKMREKNLDFDQIYDLMALRILVPTIEDCYHALGIVHGEWNPLPRRFKDYIATPKPNLYQSLHTTIVGYSGKIYEIQIRTYEMDSIAEYGIAAHWAYKEDNKGYSPEKEQEEVAAKLKWYRDLLTYAEIGESEDNDPLEQIREDIFSANVYVFTPKGDVLDFPTGATPLDFAYRVHTEVGNHTVGAIINGRIVPLTYKLKTGDVVEIKTSKSFNGPTEAWIKIVKTTHARHKITSILNKQKREALIEKGRDDFDKVVKTENIAIPKLEDKLVAKTFEKYAINNLDDFFFAIGKGSLSARGAANRLAGTSEKIDDEALLKYYSETEQKRIKHRASNDYGIIVDGLNKAQIKLGNCCHPVFGDNIIGYVSKGYGIVVHRLECHNIKNTDKDRYIEVIWDNESEKKNFDSQITISSFDRRNIVAEIINIINSINNVSITTISSAKNKAGDLLTKVRLSVNNLDTLNNTITNLQKISDIYTIERTIK